MVQAHEQLTAIDYYIGANVEVAPDVAIAAGVVLEAAPGARLVIASGVCIGTGVIVQAVGGKLTLGIGVNLGTGVLIVGQGLVGPHACIGAESSLLNPDVTAGAVVPARSLLGINNQQGDHDDPNGQSAASGSPTTADSATAASEPESNLAPANIVYGREQVTQLMKTLFPHRDALNGNGHSPP
ncbi:MAG: hypothetical protein AAF622_03160 [Cyanobacteria bacterium P01_C01_bin.147]